LEQSGPSLSLFEVEQLLFRELSQVAVALHTTEQQFQGHSPGDRGFAALLLLLIEAPAVHLEGAGKGFDRTQQPLLQVGDHQPIGIELSLGRSPLDQPLLSLLAVLLKQP
jgi:hypothetical protein